MEPVKNIIEMPLHEKIEYLNTLFDGKIICSSGIQNSFEIVFYAKNYIATKDIAIYIHKTKEIAIIWDISLHRKLNAAVNLSLNKKWDTVLPDNGEIKTYYKKLRTSNKGTYEKVLAMSVNTLIANIENIYDMLEFAKDDNDFPRALKDKPYIRERGYCSRLKRDSSFRYKVLSSYNYQCAICRCSEEKILEAAHIKPVHENGSDEVDNGICLCRNHHRMLDKNLIGINFEMNTLTAISDSVRNMPWYSDFMCKYAGKILERNK